MISFSIVLYNNDINEIKKVIKSIGNYKESHVIYLIDNSLTNRLKKHFTGEENIFYYHSKTNIGFGAGHNIAINFAFKNNIKYHFIVNPDIYFDYDVISPMLLMMKESNNIGSIMPKILNQDNSIQYLPKLLPSPMSLILRKIKWPKYMYNKFIENYELRFVDENKTLNVPILSGCFLLFNIEAVVDVGLFDDNFFMYFEDWDLSRRLHKYYKTIYYPGVSVFHGYKSDANKNFKLFKIFIKSAIFYFNKWGWFFDKERNLINSTTLSQFIK